MSSINLGGDPDRVKFGFVAYRDHDDAEYANATKFQDLTNSDGILSFINGLGHGEADDEYAEAVIDGVNEAVS